ncbi:MAG: GGDEF domain-containing protein [Halioglobus sp.]|nr:GGDEF domain-containing protein [Halioglobus sp.]
MSRIKKITALQRLHRIFVTDRLLEGSLNDARQRAKILVSVVAISALSGTLLTLSLGTAYLITRSSLYFTATVMSLITVLGYLGTLWYFKRRQSLLSGANFYAVTATFSTVAPCTITGGVTVSPYLSLVLVVPIFLFLISGRRYGIYWSLAVGVCIISLLVFELMGIRFPQIIPQSAAATFTFLTWAITLVLLVMGLIGYEQSFELLTKRITAERGQFAHEAMHDPLTGLSNRKRFFSRANEAVDDALMRKHKTAVIFIDLDDFKSINDNFGHNIGDEVLNAVAHRLQSSVRSEDTVARIGGDEFAIVLQGIERADSAELIVEKLYKTLEKPLIVGGHTILSAGSIGVAIAPDHGVEIDRLLRMADEAMYRAKQIRAEELQGLASAG